MSTTRAPTWTSGVCTECLFRKENRSGDKRLMSHQVAYLAKAWPDLQDKSMTDFRLQSEAEPYRPSNTSAEVPNQPLKGELYNECTANLVHMELATQRVFNHK